MTSEEEKTQLDRRYDTYRRASIQDNVMREKTVATFSAYLNKEGRGLELGCSDGYMTEMLAARIAHLTVVEGSLRFLEEAKQRSVDNVTFHHGLFQDYEPGEKYDYVFATFVLTHIEDMSSLMNMIDAALAPDGLLFVVVPNVRALSRQLARHMGFIDDLKALSENDLNHGHRRAYDRATLNLELRRFGYRDIAAGGLMLKQLADFQMDILFEKGMLDDSHVEGLYQLGLEYPDLCSAIYSICQRA